MIIRSGEEGKQWSAGLPAWLPLFEAKSNNSAAGCSKKVRRKQATFPRGVICYDFSFSQNVFSSFLFIYFIFQTVYWCIGASSSVDRDKAAELSAGQETVNTRVFPVAVVSK